MSKACLDLFLTVCEKSFLGHDHFHAEIRAWVYVSVEIALLHTPVPGDSPTHISQRIPGRNEPGLGSCSVVGFTGTSLLLTNGLGRILDLYWNYTALLDHSVVLANERAGFSQVFPCFPLDSETGIQVTHRRPNTLPLVHPSYGPSGPKHKERFASSTTPLSARL